MMGVCLWPGSDDWDSELSNQVTETESIKLKIKDGKQGSMYSNILFYQ